MNAKEQKELEETFNINPVKLMSLKEQKNVITNAMSTKKGRKILKSLLTNLLKQQCTQQQRETANNLLNVIKEIEDNE